MPHDPRVLEMHNCAKRDRVFIVGTGPSLLTQMELLPRLQGEDTFSCNTLPRWKDLPFSPTYHGVTDVPRQRTLQGLVWPEYDMLRFNVQWPGYDNMPEYILVEKAAENLHLDRVGFVGLGGDLPPLPTGRNTPLTLVQLAAWFGYKEIYFLGIDISRGYVDVPDITIHPNGKPFWIDDNPKVAQAIQRCAIRIRQDLEAAGRAIYDCTPVGFLSGRSGPRRSINVREIIPYRPLEEVLA